MEGISRGILWPPAPDHPERRQILHWGALRRFFGTVPVRDRGRTLLLPVPSLDNETSHGLQNEPRYLIYPAEIDPYRELD